MPCVKLETARLKLRLPEMEDMKAVLPLIGDYDVAKNLSRAPHPYAAEDWREHVARMNEGFARGTDFSFLVVRKSDGAVMGKCGVHLLEGRPFELGYWLGKPYWGDGFATEAARRVAAFTFHDLTVETLMAGWFEDNPASGRVLEKLGFVTTGTESRDCKARGAPVNCRMMRLAREDFGRRKAA